jgi:hypothetical protein
MNITSLKEEIIRNKTYCVMWSIRICLLIALAVIFSNYFGKSDYTNFSRDVTAFTYASIVYILALGIGRVWMYLKGRKMKVELRWMYLVLFAIVPTLLFCTIALHHDYCMGNEVGLDCANTVLILAIYAVATIWMYAYLDLGEDEYYKEKEMP